MCDIVWVPPGFDDTAITGTGLTVWNRVTYAESATVYPDRSNSTDVAKGYGDPCLFAVKDCLPAGNYRMPTGNPYEQIKDGEYTSDYNGLAGRWSDYGTAKSQFYPLGGRIYDGETKPSTTTANY